MEVSWELRACERGLGEKMGVGTKYTAVLNERENKSINRNNGSDIVRADANGGMIPNAGISRASRKTGRV